MLLMWSAPFSIAGVLVALRLSFLKTLVYDAFFTNLFWSTNLSRSIISR